MSTRTKRPGNCVDCGGSWVQHHQDAEDGCWCHRCSWVLPEPCMEYKPPTEKDEKPKPPVDRNVTRVGHNAPKTSKDAAASALPKSGTVRSSVFSAITTQGGMTCDELEVTLMKSHQSVSAAVNTLMNDGLIEDSGERRRTRWGNPAIVWKRGSD